MQESYIKKGFNAVVAPRIHCYRCKELIFANAKQCPRCHTFLTGRDYSRIAQWQKPAKNIVIATSFVMSGLMYLASMPFPVCLFSGLLMYALGLIVIHKVQSVRNFFR